MGVIFEGTQRSEVTISNVRLQSCRWLWHYAGEFLYPHTPQSQLLSGQESSQTSEILTFSFKIQIMNMKIVCVDLS
jgi:hypothetical protein